MTELETYLQPYMVVAVFGDEEEPHFRHVEKAAKRNTPLSLRFIGFDEQTKLNHLGNFRGEEFIAESQRLKDAGLVVSFVDAPLEQKKRYRHEIQVHRAELWDAGTAVGKDNLGDKGFESINDKKIDDTIAACKFFGLDKARVFTYYPAKGDDIALPGTPEFERYRPAGLNAFQNMVGRFLREGITPIVEIEARLLGYHGPSLRDIIQETGVKGVLKYQDSANVVRGVPKEQGTPLESYEALAPCLLHFKDAIYVVQQTGSQKTGVESAHWPHRPCGEGDGQYKEILSNYAKHIPVLEGMLQANGARPEVGGVAEPHALAAGKFGGFTGAMMEPYIFAIVGQLDAAGIQHQQVYKLVTVGNQIHRAAPK